jgi:hypothetical protein
MLAPIQLVYNIYIPFPSNMFLKTYVVYIRQIFQLQLLNKGSMTMHSSIVNIC